MKVYLALADAQRRLNSPSLREVDVQEYIDWVVKYHLPHGSGFDAGCTFELSTDPRKLVINTSFHHMNETGNYCGWTEHDVIVTPDWDGFEIRVTGKGAPERRQPCVKGYIGDVLRGSLTNKVESYWVWKLEQSAPTGEN
jgi:hypothetical protein